MLYRDWAAQLLEKAVSIAGDLKARGAQPHLASPEYIAKLMMSRAECERLAAGLSTLIKCVHANERFFLERRQISLLRLNPKTGRVEQELVAPLGIYQGVLERALDHPGIDGRRFALCVQCSAFYYKPRRSSRACSGRCGNLLRQSEHYYREKKRRERALKLWRGGKTLSKIAAELDVKVSQVRRYLFQKQSSVSRQQR